MPKFKAPKLPPQRPYDFSDPCQVVRAILNRAVEDGLLAPMPEHDDLPDWNPSPSCRTDEELEGCARILKRFIG